MSVTRPSSGNTVSASSINGMHAAVLSIVNNMKPEHLARFCLNDAQFPSIVLSAGVLEVSADVTLNTQPAAFAETEANVAAEWQSLGTYTMSPGVTLPPCILLTFAFLRLSNTTNSTGLDRAQYWAVIGHTKDAADIVDFADARMVHGQAAGTTGTGSAEDMKETEEVIFLVAVRDYSLLGTNWSLDNVKLWAAKNKGTAASAPDMTIANGVVGYIALPKQN